jgi:hypothetical protein
MDTKNYGRAVMFADVLWVTSVLLELRRMRDDISPAPKLSDTVELTVEEAELRQAFNQATSRLDVLDSKLRHFRR